MSYSLIPHDEESTEKRQLGKCQFDRLTTPHLNLKDNMLADNNLALKYPLDNILPFKIPQQGLGSLDVLALELHHAILAQIDLQTLTDFRSVNRRALQVVDNTSQYKAITSHASNALRGAISIGTARWITCEALYNTLCTAECETCGDFGGYIYLITCKRVCFLCLSGIEAYLPLLYGRAVCKFGITHQIINKLPHMRSIPGTYSPNEKKRVKRLRLVDFKSAYQAGVNLHGSSDAMKRYVADLAIQKLREFEKRSSQTRVARRPPVEQPFDGKSENPLRFVAIVQTPVYDRKTQDVDIGAYCLGCQESYRQKPKHWRRRFTEASFGTHLHECGPIRDGSHRLDETSEEQFH